MKQNFIISTIILIASIIMPCVETNAQIGWKWAISSTSSGGEYELYCINNDKNANVILTAIIIGTDSVTIGSSSYFTNSHCRTIITKTDSAGHFLWSVPTSGTVNNIPIETVVDSAGNVYGLLQYSGGTFSIGAFTFTSTYHSTILYKISASGIVEWAETVYSGISSFVIGLGNRQGCIGIDGAGHIYVSGSFNGISVTFGSSTLINTDPTGSSSDIFLVKYDTTGSVIWAENFGGGKGDFTNAIAVSADGSIFMSGGSNSVSITLGLTTLISTYTFGDSTYINFLIKLDTSGHIKWAKKINANIGVAAMITDNLNNFYFTGVLDSSVILGIDSLSCYCYAGGGTNSLGFIAGKFDSSGNYQWAVSTPYYSVPYYPGINSCAIDLHGDLWVSSPTADTVTIQGHVLHATTTAYDPMLVAQFSNTGHFKNGFILPSGGDDWGGIVTDACGNLYAGGDYRQATMSFGTTVLPYDSTFEQLFLAKYRFDSADDCPSISLNIKEPTHDRVNIYPNPSQTQLNIQLASEPIKQISIFNIMGQVVYTQQFDETRQVNEQTINITVIPSGVYLIRINGTLLTKFVKE